MSQKNPSTVLVALFCMFAMEQWMQANYFFFIQYRQFINILIGSFILLAVFRVLFFRNHKIPFFLREELLVISLFLFSFYSVFWSVDYNKGLELWVSQAPYMVVFLLLAPKLITTPDELSGVFFWQVITGGLVSLMLLLTVKWEGRQILLDQYGGNPLAVAQTAGYTLLAALLFKTEKRTELLFWVLRVAVVGVCALVAIRSGSRGQLLSTFIALLIFWPMSFRIINIRGFIYMAVIFIGLIYAFTFGISEYWSDSDRWSTGAMDEAMGGRFEQAFMLVSQWFDDPMVILFGLGNSSSYSILGIYPHNVPLEIIAEEGVIGFFIYILVVVYTILNIFRIIKLSKNNITWRRTGSVLCAFTVIAFLLSMKQGSMILNLEFFMMSMILARYRFILKKNDYEESISFKVNSNYPVKSFRY